MVVVVQLERKTLANNVEDSSSSLFRSRGPGSAIIIALRIVNSEAGKQDSQEMQKYKNASDTSNGDLENTQSYTEPC